MQEFEARLLKVIPRAQCEVCGTSSTFRFEAPLGLQYEAGQYFIIDIMVDGVKYRHHFSFSSSPTEKGYLEFTTKLRDSEFKNALKKLKEGDVVLLKGPYGNFTIKKGVDKLAMLSGGIGIAPLRSIWKLCSDQNRAIDIIMLYGNHREEDILFKDELDKLQSLNPDLKVVYTLLEPPESWNGYTGFINSNMIQKEIPDYNERYFYLCGPPGMILAMEKILLELNVPKMQLKKETFTGYQQIYQ